jgi:hypothetical protein
MTTKLFGKIFIIQRRRITKKQNHNEASFDSNLLISHYKQFSLNVSVFFTDRFGVCSPRFVSLGHGFWWVTSRRLLYIHRIFCPRRPSSITYYYYYKGLFILTCGKGGIGYNSSACYCNYVLLSKSYRWNIVREISLFCSLAMPTLIFGNCWR